MFRLIFRKLVPTRISHKLTFAVILVSSAITLITTGYQLFVDYRNDRDLITTQISDIRRQHLDSLSLGVWHLDIEQIDLEMKGLVNLRDIEFAKIVVDDKTAWQAGAQTSKNVISSDLTLTYKRGESTHKLGTLTVVGSLDNIYDRLLQRVWIILIGNAAKTFVVAAFLIILFQRLVGRHLESVAAYLGQVDINKPLPLLELDRSSKASDARDEIDEMVTAINNTREYLTNSLIAVGQSRDKLRASEQRYKALSEISPVGVYRADIDGRKTYVNDRWCEFSGLSREQALGDGFLDAIHPEDREKAQQIWQDAAKSNEHFSAEYRYLRPDGETVWVYAQAAAEYSPDGELTGYVGTVTNITASVLAEKAAKESQAWFNAFQENIPSAMNLKTADGRFVLVNNAFRERHPGHDNYIGLTCYDIFDREMADLIAKMDNEVLETGEVISNESKVGLPDGGSAYVQYIKFPVDDGAQRLVGTISPDVTKIIEAGQIIEESAQRYRKLVEDMPVAMLVHRGNEYLYANSVAAKLLGYGGPEEFIGSAVSDTVEKSHKGLIDSRAREALQAAGPLPLIDIAYHRKDGSLLFAQSTSQAVIWDGQTAVQSVFTDVTELKQVRDQLLHSQKLAAVGQLTGGLAHDFNNLLQVISGAISMIQIENADDKTREWANQIESAIMRGSGLTSQLLSFSRQQMLVPRAIKLEEEIFETQNLLKRTLGEEIEITVDVGDNIPTINIDANALQNALLNLALNSRAAMPNGGSLNISIKRERLSANIEIDEESVPAGDYLRISMTDTGNGMTPEVVERAFDPFYTTKDVGEGSGLGLSMVYGFARQSGGFASISSVQNEGTTVTLILPASEGGAVKTEKHHTGQSFEQPLKGTILIVEDDDEVRVTASKMMRGLGYQVVEAGNGATALDIIFGDEQIDGVFSDVVMPGGMSGFDLARRIKEIDRGPAVLLTSGYPDKYVEEKSLAGEPVAILQKPYSLSQLRKSMQDLLET